MAEEEPATSRPLSGAKPGWRWQTWLLASILAVVALVSAGILWLDSGSGHRFIAARIAAMSPQSGLKISVGKIDGTLYGKMVLRDVRFSDPDGLFLAAPVVVVDWWPLSWLSNRLDIDSLSVADARLFHVPHFKPSKAKKPLLPDFDIRIMRLAVDRLVVDKAVSGRSDVMAIAGDADVRSGRAIIDLSARTLHGDDRLVLALDSRPAENLFDIDMTVNAPRDGVLAAMAGIKQDANLRIKGDGVWSDWKGSLVATLDQQSAAGLKLRARSGVYSITGAVEGSAIATKGLMQRLSAPQLLIDAQGTFVNRLLTGKMSAQSKSITVQAVGGVDLGRNSFDNLTFDIALKQPAAIAKRIGGRDVIARVRADGPFSGAGIEYLLSARQLSFDKTLLHNVKARGTAQVSDNGRVMRIPVALTAAKVDGQGDLVGSVLRNFNLTGTLQKQGSVITSSPMKIRSDKFNGQLLAMFDLANARYDLALTGDVRALLVPGFGVVDVRSRVKAVPGRGGAFGLTGKVEADVRRLDNAFLRTLGGGLPRVRSDIALGPDGRLLFRALQLRAPQVNVNGSGERRRDGSIAFTGTGNHSRYGPLRLSLAGRLERPRVDVLLARPMDAAGLSQVHAVLEPDTTGYRYTANGGSTLGPFTSYGRILLPRGGQTVIAVDNLAVSGTTVHGDLLVVPGGLSGQLAATGAVAGTIGLAPVGGVQQVHSLLNVRDGNFAGPTAISVRRGVIDATLLLDPRGTNIDATVRANGLQVGKLRINRIAANAKLVGGIGKVRGSVAGQRGRLFDLQFDADVAPDEITLLAGGTLDRRPIRLSRAAHITRVDGGWQLDPVTVTYRGGSARVGGMRGRAKTQLALSVSNMPLSVLDLSNSNLGLGGLATGDVSYSRVGAAAPTASASLRVKGLTRSGVINTSAPIDMAVNAKLNADRLAVRALAASGGAIIGRAQALLTPLGRGSIIERLQSAPMQAQIRYAGPAETLWRLTAIEIIDLSGPVSVAADVRGTLASPVINGAVSTSNATFLSPVTGMRLSALKSSGRFDGSQLVLNSFSGTTRGGGQVSGSGRFDFSSLQGVGIHLNAQATDAELLNRDDIGATVSGPITIESDGNGGTISGDLEVSRSRFNMGRAAAVAQIPELKVIERNARVADFEPAVRANPWRLAVHARARNRLMVDGMGLSSEWRMTLDIGGTVTNPSLLGSAQVIRGSYDFGGRRFDMTAGTIRFDGAVPTNPLLDITAEATVSDLSATIHVTGSSTNPIISFTSNPSLPDDEVLSRILFGSSITQLSAPEALQLASAVGSLQGKGGGLDPINAIRKAAGLDRLRIIPADTASGQGTSVAVGKYITRRSYVELITDGQGYSATRVEYQVTRWLSLLGSISTLGRQSATVRVSKDY